MSEESNSQFASGVRPRTLIRDQVYARLAQEIVTGRLAPLEEIRDQDLQAEYGVSRTPIREAMIRLADVGLIEMSSNRFTRVAPIDLAAQADRAEAAGALIAFATAKVVPEMSDDELASLDARIQAILDSDLTRGGMPDGLRLWFALWVDIITLANNPTITRILDQNLVLHLSRSVQVRPTPEWLARQVRERLNAFRAALQARDALSAHDGVLEMFRVASADLFRAAVSGDWRVQGE
ncbi:GntR family transcriptional regulator [Microbacterium sp. ISL-59]|nr:GntR family transcriptional regulator [Microbacterium sp. ISL-59]